MAPVPRKLSSAAPKLSHHSYRWMSSLVPDDESASLEAVPSSLATPPAKEEHSTVRLVGVPVPSALATKISKSPVRSLEKAILVPSGDQAGAASLPGEFVKSMGADVPSELTVQTSVAAVAASSRSKAILVPSGDHE